ncbi:MAG: orotidine-5'-phosphate decarboxylase [Neomegalonema sp.]|nr:orotidine-5'-phosphate decarboxylase [Neomegalonema sp.]
MTEAQRPQIEDGERLIVALDWPLGAPNALEAEALASRIGDAARWWKIGLGMLGAGGMALALELMKRDAKIFLDLKLFDIGQTVENAVRGVVAWDPDYLTVHGDPPVVRAALEGRGGRKTKILAITILTSLDRQDLDGMMIQAGDVREITVERARRALAEGADGVIASPQEAALIRALPEAAGRLIVTPGVRPQSVAAKLSGAVKDDQKRTATPAEAIAAGADQVVIGRPIIAAADPRAAAQEIQRQLRGVANGS